MDHPWCELVLFLDKVDLGSTNGITRATCMFLPFWQTVKFTLFAVQETSQTRRRDQEEGKQIARDVKGVAQTL